jgi:uncharacterized protein (TIGR02757 family)
LSLAAAQRRRIERVGPLLRLFQSRFDVKRHLLRDPLQFPHRCANADDREAVAFLASSLAFGRVAAFKPVLEGMLGELGERPAALLADAAVGNPRGPARAAVRRAAGRHYRWLDPPDFEALLLATGAVLSGHGSLERAFAGGGAAGAGERESTEATWAALESFLGLLRAEAARFHPDPRGRSRAIAFLFPSTRGAAACKRQHLFLRWMVRPADKGADFGQWRCLSPARLVIPCDVHVARIAHALGLASRPEPSRQRADEITSNLKQIDPDDPVRFDFALSHLGISLGCRARRIEEVCGGCELRGACRYWG